MTLYLCLKCGHKKSSVKERDGILWSYCTECGQETQLERGKVAA